MRGEEGATSPDTSSLRTVETANSMVTVTKRLRYYAGERLVKVEITIVSRATTPVGLRLIEPTTATVPSKDIGLPAEGDTSNWSISEDGLRYTARLAPKDTITAVYGVRNVARETYRSLAEPPVIEHPIPAQEYDPGSITTADEGEYRPIPSIPVGTVDGDGADSDDGPIESLTDAGFMRPEIESMRSDSSRSAPGTDPASDTDGGRSTSRNADFYQADHPVSGDGHRESRITIEEVESRLEQLEADVIDRIEALEDCVSVLESDIDRVEAEVSELSHDDTLERLEALNESITDIVDGLSGDIDDLRAEVTDLQSWRRSMDEDDDPVAGDP
ncbi:MAG: hypothetical protein ABEH65_11970 [Halobacteriales archaeon]